MGTYLRLPANALIQTYPGMVSTAPVLGIHDARKDPRLDYVTGDSGIDGLLQRCREGWQLGIACFPTSMAELMAVANAGEVMPPKSTCFDPKPRSGIFVRMS